MHKIHSTMSATTLHMNGANRSLKGRGGLDQHNTDYTISSPAENGRTGEQEHCGKQTQRQI